MNPPRWTAIAQSQFEWERSALDFLRAGLPDHEPYRAWANFELVSGEGQVYEVDLLVLSKVGFWLVEVKSRPGTVSGDTHTWTWTEAGGRRVTLDNPYLLANRKAKALASLLKSQPAARKLKGPFPWLDALVFLSDPDADLKLEGAAASHVLLRDRSSGDPKGERKGILAALLHREGPGLDPTPRDVIDAPIARAITRALEGEPHRRRSPLPRAQGRRRT
ncbi:MAG: NERD domain-containing protein [Planctomycetes bacterium]|nr:NERD domain-containing protein [Planctomycetota bacterium]